MNIELITHAKLTSTRPWMLGALALSVLTACGGGAGQSLAEMDATAAKSSNNGRGKSTTTTTTSSGTTTTDTSTSTSGTTTSTTTTTTTTTTDTSTSSGSTTTTVPVGPFACATDAITCVEVTGTASVTQASVPVTFGQPFRAGDWLHATQGLVAKVDGVAVPLQTDEISSHRDGSARFAVLSAQLSNLQPGQSKIINLYTGAKTTSTPNVPANPDWNLELEAQVYDANGNMVATLVAQPQAQLAAQISSGAGRRLAGAVATEYTVALPFKDKTSGTQHPHLTARLHTRLVDGGQRIRTDVVMENTRTWTANPGNITYSFAVKRNGSTIYTQPKFTHYHHARWHKVLWTGSSAEPQARVRHNMPYFFATKAIANYDRNIQISETTLAQEASNLAAAKTGPMDPALLNPYFPATGGRVELGLLPRWAVLYLLSQDDRALKSLMVNADAAAGAPVHYRLESNGLPIDIDTYPTVSLQYGNSSPAIPVATDATIWSPDTAHQASFAYLPYLISGDSFYQDEMTFWASWNLARRDPTYREQAKGLIEFDEVRGQAWTLRSIWEAATSLPDQHPMRSYFNGKLGNNLTQYAQKYTSTNTSISPLGAITSPLTRNSDIAPWQNDFFTIVLSLIAENQEPQAAQFLNWMTRFSVGRYTKNNAGFCTARAPAYYWNGTNSTGSLASTWAELFGINYPADVGKDCSTLTINEEAFPDCALCYAANSRAMLAAASNANIADAKNAYLTWKSMTPKLDAAFAQDPTWSIVPRQ